MRIEKKGLIFAPDGKFYWRMLYAMMPTPIYLSDKKIIRVFFGITDADRFGRITFIDLDPNNPKVIINDPEKIYLDIGEDGTFDDCGVVPSSLVIDHLGIKLYYVGFQRSVKVPFMLFSGLAMSNSLDTPFVRYSIAPLFERSNISPYSNAAPFVIKEIDKYKMWFWEGIKWVIINRKKYIQAVISYAESMDGLSWRVVKNGCLVPSLVTEFSVGRPWVIKHNKLYKMFYSVRYIDKLYRIGYAESADGIEWVRKDNRIGIDVSENGWDSEMICYPSVVSTEDRTFLFYNGNNNGESGFGYAELIDL